MTGRIMLMTQQHEEFTVVTAIKASTLRGGAVNVAVGPLNTIYLPLPEAKLLYQQLGVAIDLVESWVTAKATA